MIKSIPSLLEADFPSFLFWFVMTEYDYNCFKYFIRENAYFYEIKYYWCRDSETTFLTLQQLTSVINCNELICRRGVGMELTCLPNRRNSFGENFCVLRIHVKMSVWQEQKKWGKTLAVGINSGQIMQSFINYGKYFDFQLENNGELWKDFLTKKRDDRTILWRLSPSIRRVFIERDKNKGRRPVMGYSSNGTNENW